MADKPVYQLWVNRNLIGEYSSERLAMREAKRFAAKRDHVVVNEWTKGKDRVIAIWEYGNRVE